MAAQAFVRMWRTGGKGKARAADLVIVCDLEAYRRGHALDGETCHIVGGGPIPVHLAQELGRDAFLKAVLHNGTQLHTIAHFGRKTRPSSAPPSPSGRPRSSTASPAPCPAATAATTSRDHIEPVANGGLTALENMQPLCWNHHLLKTEQDRNTGRIPATQPKQTTPAKRAKRLKRRKQPNSEGSDRPYSAPGQARPHPGQVHTPRNPTPVMRDGWTRLAEGALVTSPTEP